MAQIVSYIATSDGRPRVVDIILNASAALASIDARFKTVIFAENSTLRNKTANRWSQQLFEIG